MKVIATIHSAFPSKFGIPRQSGLADALFSTIVFEKAYRNPDALRGLDGFEYLWLIWQFSEAVHGNWYPTVRPPRLGGNTRVGVFATRSPFRPNPIGLSSVRLERIENDPIHGTVLIVSGADLMDGTPIYDIKPYLPYTDAHPNARSGFANGADSTLAVDFPPNLLDKVPPSLREGLFQVLSQDPRPHYRKDGTQVYGFYFGSQNIRFSVENGTVHVREIEERSDERP